MTANNNKHTDAESDKLTNAERFMRNLSFKDESGKETRYAKTKSGKVNKSGHFYIPIELAIQKKMNATQADAKRFQKLLKSIKDDGHKLPTRIERRFHGVAFEKKRGVEATGAIVVDGVSFVPLSTDKQKERAEAYSKHLKQWMQTKSISIKQ